MVETLKRYKAVGERRYVQAQQIWQILAARARCLGNDAPISYGDLAKLMHMNPRAGRTLSVPLGIIGQLCIDNDFPALNVLVVNGSDRKPGDRVLYRPGKTVKSEVSDAITFDWFSVRPPTTGTLRRVWENWGEKLDDAA